jgi:iron-only hydrogenase group A
MKKLNREDYCLSCEHVLGELGYQFFESEPVAALPDGYTKKLCKRCGQILNPELEKVANDYNTFLTALKNPKLKVVAFVAPSVRAGISEAFGTSEDCQTKIAEALKLLGCDYVFSMNFGADLTIMEESRELLERLKTGQNLPMLTSCCPAWVNYIQKVFPSLKPNLSTCKSPQQMMGAVINTYFAKAIGVAPTDMFVVSVVPCLAKKVERLTPGINSAKGYDVDACVTTAELAELIKQKGIDFLALNGKPFDQILGEYSAGGAGFGAAGGVSESVIKNIDKTCKITTKSRPTEEQPYSIKTATINGKKITFAQVQGIASAGVLVKQILAKEVNLDLAEVMACTGGCIGGAGQPKWGEIKKNNHVDTRSAKDKASGAQQKGSKQETRKRVNFANPLPARAQILKNGASASAYAIAKDNPQVAELYKSFLAGGVAEQILHKH